MEIKNVAVEEMNEFFDENKTRNGGGYHQPHWQFLFANGQVLHIEDLSCGDFGSRIYVTLCDGNGNIVKAAAYGTMLDENECYSDFDEVDADMYVDALEMAGVCLPYNG